MDTLECPPHRSALERGVEIDPLHAGQRGWLERRVGHAPALDLALEIDPVHADRARHRHRLIDRCPVERHVVGLRPEARQREHRGVHRLEVAIGTPGRLAGVPSGRHQRRSEQVPRQHGADMSLGLRMVGQHPQHGVQPGRAGRGICGADQRDRDVRGQRRVVDELAWVGRIGERRDVVPREDAGHRFDVGLGIWAGGERCGSRADAEGVELHQLASEVLVAGRAHAGCRADVGVGLIIEVDQHRGVLDDRREQRIEGAAGLLAERLDHAVAAAVVLLGLGAIDVELIDPDLVDPLLEVHLVILDLAAAEQHLRTDDVAQVHQELGLLARLVPEHAVRADRDGGRVVAEACHLLVE